MIERQFDRSRQLRVNNYHSQERSSVVRKEFLFRSRQEKKRGGKNRMEEKKIGKYLSEVTSI